MIIFLGLLVIAGWYLHSVTIIQIRPGFAAMQYMTASCFVLSGLALFGIAAQWPRTVPLLAGGLVAMTGGLLMVEYLAGLKAGFDILLAHLPSAPNLVPIRPSLPTSVCFTLCGLALVARSIGGWPATQRAVVWMLASVTLALCIMALSGYFTGLSGTHVWGAFVGMAIHTAAGMFILSLGLLLTQAMNGKPLSDDPWLPVPVAIATVTATLILWQALLTEQRAAMQTKAVLIAQDLAATATIRMNEQLRILERMKRRWEVRGGTPYEEWKDDVLTCLSNEPVFAAIAWQSPDFKLSWIEPQEESVLFNQLDVSKGHRWDARKELERARMTNATILSPIIILPGNEKGLLTYLPLFPHNEFGGFIVGVFWVHTFLDNILDKPDLEHFDISVFEGDQLFYGPPVTSQKAIGLHPTESVMEFHDRRWRFVVSPTAAYVEQNTNKLPNIILLLGYLLMAALVVTVRSWQQAKMHSQSIERANRSLQLEIQQRARIESKLRESEETLRLVLDSATGVSVIATDPKGIITYFSKGSERMLGYEAEELVGKASPAVLHDEAEITSRGEELTKLLNRSVAGFAVFTAMSEIEGREKREWSYLCKDGKRKAVELTVTILRDEQGALTGFLGTAMDVTARKRMESDLRATVRAVENAHALLEAAGRIAQVGYWEIPLDGGPPIWSTATYAIHEVEPGTPLTMEMAIDFFHPDDRETVSSSVARAVEIGEAFEFECRLITARGRQVWVHSRGEPVKDETGTLIGVRGVLQDVNEQHKSADLLNERNKQLEEATRQALTYARAKAEFLANMSHEIRTPLNAIIGMSEILQDFIVESHQRELLDTIRVSGDVLLTLINDILDFSKIESGQLELEHVAVDLHDCIESSFNIVSSLAAKKKLDLLYWIEPSVPVFVQGDMTRLRQVLVNLVTNAVKFTTEGEIFVRIHKANSPDGHDLLRVSVRDTGIGIPRDKQHRLFQAFSQVDTSTTRRFGGTGLGLAICQRLIEIMKGRIWVESEAGQGAEFIFEIPLEPAAITPPTIYLRGANHDLDEVRVLLVDDNQTNRWILENQTAAWGMKTRETGSPSEALKWIAQGDPFDFAIIDGQMPEMDGFELAQKIREYEHLRHMPILILTSMSAERPDMAKLGPVSLMAKPVKTAALFEVISKLVLGRSPVRPASQPDSKKALADDYPLTILVAEDNPVNQRVISLQLNRLGYQSELVSNGLETLVALQARKFDVVLLDIQMPEMDGFSTAREICHIYPREERPRLIALTADASQDDRDQCAAAGMNDFLSKPVRSQELAAALRRAHQAIHNI